MTRRAWILLVAGRAAVAQIGPAQVGYVVDASKRLRAVFGVAGAFTIGPPLDEDVLSAAYSGSSLVVKKGGCVLVDGKQLQAPAGPVVVVFDRTGRASEMFFPEQGILWTSREGRFDEHTAAGIVSDIAFRGDELIVAGVSVRLPSAIRSVSQMGERWMVAHCEQGWYAIRGNEVWELPEVAVEVAAEVGE